MTEEMEATTPVQLASRHARRANPAPMMILAALALVFMACASWLTATAHAGAQLAVPVASAARLSGDAKKTRFVADLTFAIPCNVYVLASPYRVMIDLPEVDFRLGGKIGVRGTPLIHAVRYGRMAPGKSRIVLEAGGPVLIRKSYIRHPKDGLPARLVVDLVRTDKATFDSLLSSAAMPLPRTATAPPLHPLRDNDPVPEDMPAVSRAYRHLVERAASGRNGNGKTSSSVPLSIGDLLENSPLSFTTSGARGKPAKVGRKRAAKPAASGRRHGQSRKTEGITGRALPLIVIDPGHGGKDPGAPGLNGAKEKNLVLAFARELRARLLATGKYRVQLTRDGDYFLTLPQRVQFARDRGARLFISIHADKFASKAAHGAAIYTVSEEASDEEAAELARKENASDIIGGVDLGKDSGEIKGILIDLAMRETKNHSVWFARQLAAAMHKVTRLRARPVRSADFRVLRNPEVPSVLIEMGYVSNPSDLRNMRSARWRKKTAAAMTRAIGRYFSSRVAFNR